MKKGKRYLLWIFAAFLVGMLFPRAYSAVDQTYQQLRVLVEVLELVRDNYVDQVDTKKLIYGAAEGVIRQLDDFSQFMDPEVNKRVKSDTEGEFGGLGISIVSRDGYITVVSPTPGTPAYKAGIMPNDRIIKIEGESTKDMFPDDAVKKLRGAVGTKVKFTVAREPEGKTPGAPWAVKEYELERAKIVPEVASYKLLDDKIGYLRLADFSGHMMDEAADGLAAMKKKGMEALVVDLRFNPGGLVVGAVDLTKLFLSDNKMIVYTKGRKPENYQEFRSGRAAPYAGLPLVVLVNGGSASSSEIVAGALQDNKRAVIIGSRTFGKASVQSIIPLSDGSGLRLTVAHYYTPNGKSIHRDPKTGIGGIVPDIALDISPEADARSIRQKDQIHTPGKEPVSAVKPEDMVKDEALARAVEILKARDAFINLKPAQ
ncbi:MAG: S41 family peptidase [Elusimicrobiales bacterium]|nr:S41 family peptidase [Elusimicrobiales bacterium]